MNRKKLYLHIGQPKTGTSAIQGTLVKSRKVLLDNSVHYPGAACFLGHNALALSMVGIERFGDFNFHLDSFYQEVTMMNAKTVVCSSEHFDREDVVRSHNLKHFLDRLSKQFDIKVIIYVRNPSDLIESLFYQFVKHNNAKYTFDDMVNDPHYKSYLDIEGKVNLWADVVGKDNVMVNLFDRNTLVNGDVIDDFLSIVGINCGTIERPRFTNKSLNLESAYFCWFINNLDLTQDNVERFKPVFDELSEGKCTVPIYSDLPKLYSIEFAQSFSFSDEFLKRYPNLNQVFEEQPNKKSFSFSDFYIDHNNFNEYLAYLIENSDLTRDELKSAIDKKRGQFLERERDIVASLESKHLS
ncbi:sulfotransferase domain-containing protein [Vibrio sp. 10N.247.311.18]|uniref:sulfotransferase domain-containing protein n=1 Tax=unclassified Vibrio TaxID=2614977 RepID=UPI0035504387